MQPTANGSAVPKAPAPEAAEATARTMSIADQIAFGKRNVASLFQVNDLLMLLAIASWLQRCPMCSSCHQHLHLWFCPVSGGSYDLLCCAVLCCAVGHHFGLAYVCRCAALCFAATQQCIAVLCCAAMFVPASVQLTPCLIQDASRELGQQLRSSFALPSSSSPPKLYQRSPHLVQIYGNESEEEEEDEADEPVR